MVLGGAERDTRTADAAWPVRQGFSTQGPLRYPGRMPLDPSTSSPTAPPVDIGLSRDGEILALQQEIDRHFLAAIEATPMQPDPFPHVFVEGCFPQEI
jgi:hypothetical protein